MGHDTRRIVTRAILLPVAILLVNTGYPTKIIGLAIENVSDKGFITGTAVIIILLYMVLTGGFASIILLMRLYSKILAKAYKIKMKRRLKNYEKKEITQIGPEL